MSNLIKFSNSILNNNGGSYNLLTGELNPNDGFMVSIEGHETIYKYYTESLQYQVASYIKEHAYILCSNLTKQQYFIGAWVHENKLYLDVSIKVDNEAEAKKLAIENNQLAYYDNKKKETIYLK